MTSQIPRLDVYDPKTLAVMDQAFASIWATVHHYENQRNSAQGAVEAVCRRRSQS
jgi:hypothetical protein